MMIEWQEVGPDGVTDIIGEPEPPSIVALADMPSNKGMTGLVSKATPPVAEKERTIILREDNITLTPGQTKVILDSREEGKLDYVHIKASTGSTASAGDLAVFLQMDAFAQGGTDSGTSNLKLSTLSDLNLPADVPGTWFLTKDTTTEKVAVCNGYPRGYENRIRLVITNTNSAQNLSVDFVEMTRLKIKALR